MADDHPHEQKALQYGSTCKLCGGINCFSRYFYACNQKEISNKRVYFILEGYDAIMWKT
jgi:hypothetical protein